MRSIIAALALLAAAPASAAPADWVEANKTQLLREYVELLAIPNVAANLPEIRRSADHISAMMRKRGLSPRLLESEDGKVPPLIYGEWKVPGAKKTYIIYAHYDGQPVTPADWKVTEPFTPVLLTKRADRNGVKRAMPAPGERIEDEWRVYARSASDDKAGVFAILAAIDALKADKKQPSFNLKVVFEGEEEQGSPNLARLIARHRETLLSDGWIIVDGAAHQGGTKMLNLGVRGDVNMHLTVYGPVRPLHSGHYGNWVPNPAMALAKLIASMKDETGRVTVAGFYDDVVPLTAQERQAIAGIPALDASLKKELGLGWTEGNGAALNELIQQPSLNINGIRSADVGASARNVIPSTASATLDLRLALGNDPKRQVEKVVNHIKAQGFHVLDREPTMEERSRHPKIVTVSDNGGYPAERTPLDHPFARSLANALLPSGLVIAPSMGGSLPLYLIRSGLGAPTASIGFWNHDNNQHSEDENIRLGNLWAAIPALADVMTMK